MSTASLFGEAFFIQFTQSLKGVPVNYFFFFFAINVTCSFVFSLTMEKQVYDPFGYAITISSPLDKDICLPDSTINFNLSTIIENPAMVFETVDGTGERFYLRTIEWENRILVRARKSGNHLIADHYQINPSIEVIQNLMRKCRLP